MKHIGKGTGSIPSSTKSQREQQTHLIQIKGLGRSLPKLSQLSSTILNIHFQTAGKKCLLQNLLSLMIQQCGPGTQEFIYLELVWLCITLLKLESDPYDHLGPPASPELGISFVKVLMKMKSTVQKMLTILVEYKPN